jgi:hypothetical protein
MGTTLAKVDIVNQALAQIGVASITDMDEADSVPAEYARLIWQTAFGAVARSDQWNCLTKPAVLQAVAQTPIDPDADSDLPDFWTPATAYAVDDRVRFGNLVSNTSTASFTNDLTAGFWQQTDITDPYPFSQIGQGSQYPSGWAYKYSLPADFILLTVFNNAPCNAQERTWEIMGLDFYTNWDQAVIKYICAEEDTTKYDPLFVETLILKLACLLATKLRQDDTQIAALMERRYTSKLREARTKNGNERRAQRFIPQANSTLINSRYWSTNG